MATVTNAGELTINWQGFGHTWHNVLGLAFSPGLDVTGAVADSIRDALITAWESPSGTDFHTHVSNGVELVGCKITDLRTDPHPVFERPGSTEAGTNGTAGLPPAAAICISLSTDHPGRSGRGRVYLAGLTRADLQDTADVPPSPLFSAGVAFLNDIKSNLAGIGSDDVLLAVVSRHLGERFEVTSVTVKTPRWANQRRRAL